MYKPRFFTFIFAVLLCFCSCSVTLFRVRDTWYGVRGPHHFWGAPVTQQPLPTKFGIKVVTATYCSLDCKNSLYYRTSRDQPHKLLYKLMSSALFRKIWCIYLYPVRRYWHFSEIQDGGRRHLAWIFRLCEFGYSDVLKVWYLCSVPNWVKIYALVTEIDVLMLQTFIWWRHAN